MKIGVVGANSQVGTEICFMLNLAGYEVIPIVRNVMGTAFLQHHNFSCRIEDITNEEDAKRALRDCDSVVIAAYMWPQLQMSAKENWRINEKLVENAVKYAKSNASIIYFSSIRALSKKIDPRIHFLGPKPYYDKEKRHLEKKLQAVCRKEKKQGYILRLGHVFGINQQATKQLCQKIASASVIKITVPLNKPSNIVHTVTITEAIIKCMKKEVRPGIYTLTNHPQWTWEEVIRCYNKEARIMFKEKSLTKSSGYKKSVVTFLMKHYLTIRKILPQKMDARIQYNYKKMKIKQEIAELQEDHEALDMDAFAYNPAPGRSMPSLTETKNLIKNYKMLEHIFKNNN
ncbi:MAG: NAD(P)-dependent oxidoreductase [Nanoarchaeota archaeon]